ncbi:MAG: DUF2278 family protein [Thermodesulfobacteriota bacterium]|nr:DUF2278 family protein [Thermodesulfobacteriota bacterium]
MAIKNYGVWVGKPVRVSAERAEDDPESPHIHLFYDDKKGGKYDGLKRASINVKSKSKISELVFWLIQDFQHPITDQLSDLDVGFEEIQSQSGTIALDYIRGNLMDLSKGRILPHDKPDKNDDIIDFVQPELQAAINRGAAIYLFGEPYSDNQGIHDVHMNQGSQGGFAKYNGVWQDGGIIMHFSNEDRFTAIFLAFASQAIHTDEVSGDAIGGSQNFADLLGHPHDDIQDEDKPVIRDDQPVKIIAALVNPSGPEGQAGFHGRPEMVYLMNRTEYGISLNNWSILNKNDDAHVISNDIWLAPGEVRSVTMGETPLSNKGGLITLLDYNGIKIDGVSYTKKQANEEGKLIVF